MSALFYNPIVIIDKTLRAYNSPLQISCKITHSMLNYVEQRSGLSINTLTETFDGPEEFLRDPYFWVDIAQAERFLARASRLTGDGILGYSVGSQVYSLQAFGALDNVFKMMTSPQDYYNNLKRFFSYFLAPLDDFSELEHGDTHVKFIFPVNDLDYPHCFGFLRGVLESLPKYTGHPSAQSQWDPQSQTLFLTWDTAQPSLFDQMENSEGLGQVVNPLLVQTLSAQLEATERGLQEKNREALLLKNQLDQLRGELQTQLREKVYAEKMAGLAQLAAGVAHEINNPLSYVTSNLGRFQDYFYRLKNYIAVLEKRDDTHGFREERTRHDVDFILNETPVMLSEAAEGLNRVKEIIKDLSSLAHPRGGRTENKIPTNLNGLLESCLKVFQDEINDRVKIEKNFELNALVDVFPVRMSQVFMNLISNGLHAFSHHGEANIISKPPSQALDASHVSCTSPVFATESDRVSAPIATLTLKTFQRDQLAFVEIADNGMGMDEETLSKIFTPFFTTKEAGRGTGLGLSIAQSIVEAHRGRINVESRKGHGSCFTVSLPLEKI